MKKRILFLSVLTLFLSSCGIFSPLSENTGSISIKMPEGSERSNDVSEITSFSVELYNSDNIPVVQIDSAPGKSITFESLEPGSYAIFIKAFKPSAASCAAYGEKTGVIVKAGATTYETITLKWVITDWTTLSAKLNNVKDDVGNVYVSGEFDVTSTISFSGTATIIPIGSVTFTRSGSFTEDFFFLNPDSMTFKGSETAPIVFDGKNIEASLIKNMGTTTFEYCSFVNNSTSTDAPIYFMNNYECTSTFKFCTFTGNIGSDGGAVYVGTSENVSFEYCTFESNTASSCGGAVYIKPSATATFSNCTFNSNTAIYYGGAVYIERSGTGSFSDCTFEGNRANTCGGAINSSGTADITNCTFTSNSATSGTGYGGAINIDSGTVDISSITCSGNFATTGKDIYHSNGTLNIGGTVDGSIDIYMYNNSSSPVLVPVKGITLADETYPINVEMYGCSAETTVLTQSAGMTTFDFAAAINCFTLTNNGFAIGSNGTAVTQ